MLVEHYAGFRRWIAARSPLWTDFRVAGVAIKTKDGWIARRILVTLGAERFADRVLSTDHVLVFERHLAFASLAKVLLALTHGEVPKDLNLGVPVRVFSAEPSSAGSEERAANTGFAYAPYERFARFELKFSGGGSRPGGSVFTQDLQQVCDREVSSRGQGRLADVVGALGLTRNDGELRAGGDECIAQVIACIPARIASFTQTADRTQVVVTTEVAAGIRKRVTLLMTVLSEGWRDPIAGVIDANGKTVFDLPEQHDVQFTLLFDDYPAQCVKFDRLPLTTPGIRQRALAMLEGVDRTLLADGLFQRVESDANAFERSTIHLFGLLGFSGFWWGPNRQNGTPKMPMPTVPTDCLVFSSDDAVVGLVECTIQPPGLDKAIKLVRRAERLQRELRTQTGEASLRVVPVLAACVHRDSVHEVVQELCDKDGLVVLTEEKLQELYALVECGARDQELSKALPEELRAGLAVDRLFARVF